MEKKKLRLQATGLLIGFVVQFLGGMIINLFITLPNVHPGTTSNEYFARSAQSLVWALSGGGGVVLAVHTYIALGLLLGCLGLLARSIQAHNRLWIWTSSVAALFTLGAFFNGLSFLDYNEGFSSMIMATCWLVAVSALVIVMIRSIPRETE